MKFIRTSSLHRLLSLASTLFICACQPAPPPNSDADSNTADTRSIADALDRTTADARKARISNLSYDAFINIAAGDVEFGGDVVIRFDLSNASSDLTLDFAGGALDEVKINGKLASVVYNGFFITLPADRLKAGPNAIEIAYRHAYGHDGTGLHRFVDPEDGLTYMHSYMWPYYANRVLPSFDQPSLKAKFKLRVNAPKDWTVVSAGPGTAAAGSDDTRLWTFAETPKISTYVFSLHAGPYEIWTDSSGAVPLRLMARQSLAQYVVADEWLAITNKGMTFFSNYFDIPYPFEKYDQLIVPEFNIGGMENVAAVTFTERTVQRQPSNRAERERRAAIILHELAHMWFGDLVTHEWWNGMWLNESFATQMETLALLETTEFRNQWHGFFTNSKQAAYARDSRVTTHPIEMPVSSTLQFSELFDSITYDKGGSALKQLQFRVGPENYRQGVSAYLKENAFGTTDLADFISFQSKASGTDLGPWSEEWLMKPGFNTLTVAPVCANDMLDSLTIMQSAPKAWPYLRTHVSQLALYSADDDGSLVVTHTQPVTISGERTQVAVPKEQPCPALINPNFEDWTYAKIALSIADEAVLRNKLDKIRDPLSRSMFLAALYDKAMAGDLPLADYIQLTLRLAATEQNFRVLQQITKSAAEAIQMMQRLRPETDNVLPGLLDEVEMFGLTRAQLAKTHDLKHLWFEFFVSVASSDAAIGTTRALLDGSSTIDGIEMSADVRWQLLIILSRHDAPGIAQLLESEIARDTSDLGQRSYLSAKAAAPNLANKKHWLDELQSPQSVTNFAKQRAVMRQLFPPTQTDLQFALLEQILSTLPTMSREADPYFLSSYANLMLMPMCKQRSSARMRSALDEFSGRLNPTALRFLREAHQADAECFALRAVQ